jgi:hypothetical protein
MEHGGEVWVARATTRSSRTRPARRSSRCAAIPSSPNRPSACRSTAGIPSRKSSTTSTRWWRATPTRAHQRAVRLRLRQGPAHPVRAGPSIGPIVCHGAVEPLNRVYREGGVALPPTRLVSETDKAELKRALVLAPPSAAGSTWMRRFGDYSDAFASGWMLLRGARRRRGVDRGFVLSDHADWPGLLGASAPPAPSGHRHPRLDSGDGALACQIGLDAKASTPNTATMRRGAAERGRAEAEARCVNSPACTPNSTRPPPPTASSRRCSATSSTPRPRTPPGPSTSWPAASRARRCRPSCCAEAAIEYAGLDEWLFDECYAAVGDLAETIAHILPAPKRHSDVGLAEWMEERIGPCAAPTPEIRERCSRTGTS